MRLFGSVLTAAALIISVSVGTADRRDRPPPIRIALVPPTPVAEDERVERDLSVITTTTAPPTTTTTTAPPTTTTTAPPAPPPTLPTPVAPSSADEARVLELVNGERAKQGVPPLQLSGGARTVAQAWSAQMSRSGMAHNPDLRGDLARAGVTGWRTFGENVGFSSEGVDDVHRLFMQSEGHRANILKPGYGYIGIGVVEADGTAWVTLDFVGY